MDFDKDTLYKYMCVKYNFKIEKDDFILMLDKYKTETKFTEIYNNIFITLFGLTLDSLNSLALDYDFKKEYNSISDSMKELQTTINILSEKIDLLGGENRDLRDNYWRLNQSLIKSKN
jgi:hypothetical protein